MLLPPLSVPSSSEANNTMDSAASNRVSNASFASVGKKIKVTNRMSMRVVTD